MKRCPFIALFVILLLPSIAKAQAVVVTEPTSAGDLRITSIGHGTLMLEFGGNVIHVDPWSDAGVSAYPSADWILITHEHGDHFDPDGIQAVTKAGTRIVAPAVVAAEIPGAIVVANGERVMLDGVEVEAVPMYNENHAPGVGNGYIFNFADKRVYVAGDTGCTAEMRLLADIDIAFLPMYAARTMTPEVAAECARAFRPGVVYAYHYRNDDPRIAGRLLADTGIEVRIGAPSP